jgi:hypothetical protein
VHEDEIGAGALLEDEQSVSLAQAYEAAAARPAVLQRADLSRYGVRHARAYHARSPTGDRASTLTAEPCSG